ncbi:Do family serine endopeptidase [Amylibacter cionae]|uniref:Do family serine endopeptidase n=1 Tax=Neptunicoccus cionae TaxID=2035344 RepID=UPI000C762BE7|nr:serine protease [Amylibacter cionae]
MKAIAAQPARTRNSIMAYAAGALVTLAFLIVQTLGAAARGAPDSFADLAERLSPAVVNITTSTMVAGRNLPAMPRAPRGSPLEELFPDLFGPQGNGEERQRRASALGSGFIISADGYIVTNNHVIDGADEIQIELFDGGPLLDAKLIGTDEKTDIALLKVEAEAPLPFVAFGDSNVSRVGDWVLAIGNPLGQGFSVSAGIISARNRSLRGTYDDYIQTDAAINKGNSGGPLFDMDGNVIGVNTAIISPTGGSIGLGFAMSSNVVTKVVAQLKEYGETRRGWLGVQIQDVDEDIAEAVGLDSVKGALVSNVPEGPAKEAGILAGDIILNFDGKDVSDTRGLVRAVGNAEVGKAVRVVVFREGKTMTLKVTLGRREDAERDPVVPVVDEGDAGPTEREAMGMRFTALTGELRSQLGLDDSAKGVAVLSVDESSDAFTKGLRAGDLISEVGQKPVTTPKDVTDALKAANDAGRKSILLLVHREGEPRFVALSLDD